MTECKGTGNIWRAFDGSYLGHCRCDDLDEMDECPQCYGDGITWLCDECQEALEVERERSFTNVRGAYGKNI